MRQDSPKPFLTLAITEINGWAMALCPELEVSACGPDRNIAVNDLNDMIKRNASLILKGKEHVPSHVVEWAKEIAKQTDVTILFKRQI
ncbi:MAG: hypothetical protein WC532_05555 [Candidatus Omnitrophota bacterium]